jgi:23S rRNA (cytosine1962-C5)-methyltransferase
LRKVVGEVTFAFSVAGLIIKPRARIFHGHDWVYASEILKTFGNPVAGEVVSLKDGKDRLIGSAIYKFFRRRIALAIDYRRRRGIDPRLCRLVWSESDGLPGLIVDRYGDCLVLQTLTTAMDQRKTLLTEVLVSLLAPAAVIERNDAPIRRAEGLELTTGLLHGEAPGKIEIEFGGLFFAVDLLHGQKTGFYLDQIENYQRVAAVAHGRRVLDCFSNQGAFALACARQGAASVLGVEAVATARGNVERNALAGIEWQEANVFDFLPAEERRGAQYDLIILDPPSFTKSKSQLGDALRGYKEIHLRALKLLSQDGLLATFCCSHHVSATEFREMLIDASVDARRAVRQIGRFTQAADHPVVPTLPETEYLQGYLLEAMPAR